MMKLENRKSVYENLKRFDCLAKEDSFIEVIEWTNGEGFDISIDDNKHLSLTYGEIDAINYLTMTLQYAER